MITEQEKPPLLSKNPYLENKSDWSIKGSYIIPADIYEAGKKAQREADIKWMKEHCIIKGDKND